MSLGVESLLLVVPAEAGGWEVVDVFGHRRAAAFADKSEAIAWSCDEAYRGWGRVVVCDEAFEVESRFAWEPPDEAEPDPLDGIAFDVDVNVRDEDA